MAITCPGCKRKFNDPRSFGNHKRNCKSYLSGIGNSLQNYVASQAKKRRLEESPLPEFIQGSSSGGQLNLEAAIDLDPPTEPLSLPSPPRHYPSGRPSRKSRLPARFRDELPPNPPAIINPPSIGLATQNVSDHVLLSPIPEVSAGQALTPEPFKTETNSYGIYRIYPGGKPSHTPDENFNISALCDSPNMTADSGPRNISSKPWWSVFGSKDRSDTEDLPQEDTSFFPCPNASVFRLMHWFYNGSNTKTLGEVDKLVSEVILHESFKQEDFIGFRASKEAQRLDDIEDDPRSRFSSLDGWKEASLKISLPFEGHSHKTESEAPVFEVPGFHYRSLTDVILASIQETAAEHYHLFPFQSFWIPSPDQPEPERIYSEAFDSDRFLKYFEDLPPPTDGVENVALGIGLWSDATQLTNFGDASAWPIYVYVLNASQHIWLKPTTFSAHHVGYIPKLVDEIQDVYCKQFGTPASAATLSHLRRELFQAVWFLLLDEKFVEAYRHGLLHECVDGIIRRFFPRFIFYSMDYPEKVLLFCIQYLAKCPCPHCTILKKDVRLLGTKTDMKNRERKARVDDQARIDTIEKARKLIYQRGRRINGVPIIELLGEKSQTPTRNAFSERLKKYGFDFYNLYAPDTLHELDSGVVKAVLTHLTRILHAIGGDTIQMYNERYRQIPPFGLDTIRKFNNNVSAMKQLAARDWEDMLQCSMPVFEGLLPQKANAIVQDLLFELLTFQGLAKLRLHTESTVKALENSAARLGEELRRFEEKVCPQFTTKELPSESAARGRRKATQLSKRKQGVETPAKKESANDKVRRFNMATYKIHALGYYPMYVRLLGPLVICSTQTGEVEHRRVKRFYSRVNKGKFRKGLTKLERRGHMLRKMMEHSSNSGGTSSVPKTGKSASGEGARVPFDVDEALPATRPDQHYQMSADVRHKVNIQTFLGDNEFDPALVNFLPSLRRHLVARILGKSEDDIFSDEELGGVTIVNNRLYKHKVLRINYTTYDMRRAQDSLNARTQANFMMLSQEDGSDGISPFPYWFGKMLGVFHAMVLYLGPGSKSREATRMDFVFARWYGRDPEYQGGWAARRLHRIGFIPLSTEIDSFGFVDPNDIIRGIHLIPSFNDGHTFNLLPPSLIARVEDENDKDWEFFYVNMFADRDLMMRFRGGGVGHNSTRVATSYFLGDRYKGDQMALDEEMNEQPDPEGEGSPVPSESAYLQDGHEGDIEEDDEDDEGGYEKELEADKQRDDEWVSEDEELVYKDEETNWLGPEDGMTEETMEGFLGYSNI